MTFRLLTALILGLSVTTPALAEEQGAKALTLSDEAVLTPDVNFITSPLYQRDAEKRQNAVDAIIRIGLERAERKINETLSVAFSA